MQEIGLCPQIDLELKIPPAVQPTFERIFSKLRKAVSGVHALVLVGADGELVDHAATRLDFDVSVFAAEYATLIRIAQRTAQDTSMGDLTEYVAVADAGVIVARRLSSNHFAIALCSRQEQLGRLRYELKVGTRDLDKHLMSS